MGGGKGGEEEGECLRGKRCEGKCKMRGEEEVEVAGRGGELYNDWPCTNDVLKLMIWSVFSSPPAVGLPLPGWCTLSPNPLGLPQPPPGLPCRGDVDWSVSCHRNQPRPCGHSLCGHCSLSFHHQQHRRDPKPAHPSTRNCNRSTVCATYTVPGAVCIGSCSVHIHLSLTEVQSLSTQAQENSKKKHKRPCERGKPSHSKHRHGQQF